MISNDPEVYKAAYPAFNPFSGEVRIESEFHALAANDDSCNDAFTWVKVEDLFDEVGFQIDSHIWLYSLEIFECKLLESAIYGVSI